MKFATILLSTYFSFCNGTEERDDCLILEGTLGRQDGNNFSSSLTQLVNETEDLLPADITMTSIKGCANSDDELSGLQFTLKSESTSLEIILDPIGTVNEADCRALELSGEIT